MALPSTSTPEEMTMPQFYLGRRSLSRLVGVHPDLIRVVKRAILVTVCDFTVLEGIRSVERQLRLFEMGGTTTMNSRHLTGHAVDLGAYIDGEVRWDWPLYHQLGAAMKLAAVEEGVKIEWGGDWQSFKDGPHFQLPWADYPA